jgi:hypothetical protein
MNTLRFSLALSVGLTLVIPQISLSQVINQTPATPAGLSQPSSGSNQSFSNGISTGASGTVPGALQPGQPAAGQITNSAFPTNQSFPGNPTFSGNQSFPNNSVGTFQSGQQPGFTSTGIQVVPGAVVQFNQTPTTRATVEAAATSNTNSAATPPIIVIQAPASAPNSQGSGAIANQIGASKSAQATLDAPLLQATCAQNWGRAIQIVDRAIAAAPANQPNYRAQLLSYWGRLQNLQANRVAVPNWRQQCGG